MIERINLGSEEIPQELSEISDASLVAIAHSLRFLTDIYLNHKQRTDAGLLALAKGVCRQLRWVRISNSSWGSGYPQLITKQGVQAFDEVSILWDRTSLGRAPLYFGAVHCETKVIRAPLIRRIIDSPPILPMAKNKIIARPSLTESFQGFFRVIQQYPIPFIAPFSANKQ